MAYGDRYNHTHQDLRVQLTSANLVANACTMPAYGMYITNAYAVRYQSALGLDGTRVELYGYVGYYEISNGNHSTSPLQYAFLQLPTEFRSAYYRYLRATTLSLPIGGGLTDTITVSPTYYDPTNGCIGVNDYSISYTQGIYLDGISFYI